jgi:hypothetical protein
MPQRDVPFHPIYLTEAIKDEVVQALRHDYQHDLAEIVEKQWADQVKQAARKAKEEKIRSIEAHNRLVEAGWIWNPLEPFGDKKKLLIEVPE